MKRNQYNHSKNIKSICWYVILSIVIGFLFSCNSLKEQKNQPFTGEETFDILYQNAEQSIINNPDSTIFWIDSLLKVVPENFLEQEQYLKLFQLKESASFKANHIDSAMAMGEKVRTLALELGDSLSFANTLLLIKNAQLEFRHLKTIEKLIPEAISIYDQLGMDYEKGLMYTLYGKVFLEKDEFNQSQQCLMKAYQIFQKLDSTSALSDVCNILGNNFSSIKSRVEAEKYFKKALNLAEKSKSIQQQVSILNNLGIFYRNTNSDTSLYYYNKILALLQNDTSNIVVLKAQYNIANVYFDNGNLSLALNKYKQIHATCTERKIFEGVAMATSGMVSVFEQTGEYDKAIQLLKNTIQKTDSIGHTFLTTMLKEQLLTVYETKGDINNAFWLSKEINANKDSVMAFEKQLAIHDLELYYKIENEKLEIANLETKIAHQKLSSFFKMTLIVLLALVVVYLLVRHSIKNKNRLQQIRELEEKHRFEAELKRIKSEKAAFLQNIVDQQKEELLSISKENETIRNQFRDKKDWSMSELSSIEDIKGIHVNAHYWENLTLKFNLIYPDFLQQLQKLYPNLTPSEIQFCMSLKLNIPLKDIASIFNITPQSLYKKKYRLLEKMSVEKTQDNIHAIIQEIG